MSERNMRDGAWRPPRRSRPAGHSGGDRQAEAPPPDTDPASRSFFRDHPGAAITFGALALASVGIVHQFVLLSKFEIQYFEYATAESFIVAAGKVLDIGYLVHKQEHFFSGIAFAVLLFAGAAYLLTRGAFTIFKYKRRSDPDSKRNDGIAVRIDLDDLFRGIGFLLFLYLLVTWLAALALAYDTAETRADWIKRGLTDTVIVKRKSELSHLPSSETPKSEVRFITATGAYLFLYEIKGAALSHPLSSVTRTVHMVPRDTIASMERVEWPSGH